MVVEIKLTIVQKIKKSKRVSIWGLESGKWDVSDFHGLYNSHAYLPSGRKIGAPNFAHGSTWAFKGIWALRPAQSLIKSEFFIYI
jgi:hypothetical protein